jgi:hypothetical protein
VRMTSRPGDAASCLTMANPMPLFPPEHSLVVAWLRGCVVAWLRGCVVAWLRGCVVMECGGVKK